jgi:hypothetical protein
MVASADTPRGSDGFNDNLPFVLPTCTRAQDYQKNTSTSMYDPHSPKFPTKAKTDTLKVPRKITTFHSDPKYTREDMFYNESNTLHTLHNWIELSSGTHYPFPNLKHKNFI